MLLLLMLWFLVTMDNQKLIQRVVDVCQHTLLEQFGVEEALHELIHLFN